MRDAVDPEVILERHRRHLTAVIGQLNQLLRNSDPPVFETVLLEPDPALLIGNDPVEQIHHWVFAIGRRGLNRSRVDRHVRQVGVEHAVVGIAPGVAETS